MRTDLTHGENNMAEPNDPSSPPRKPKVINWNPDQEEGLAKSNSGMKAYFGGAAVALLILAVAAGVYFLFIYEPRAEERLAGDEGTVQDNTVQAFRSVSYARGLQEDIARKHDAVTKMPTGNNETLRQMLIKIGIEKEAADTYFQKARYGRAVDQYNYVGQLISTFTSQVEKLQRAQGLYDSFIAKNSELERSRHMNEEAMEQGLIAASEGKRFLDAGSFDPALQRLEEATAKQKEVEKSINDYIKSNAAMGQRFIALGKRDEAIEALTKVLEVDPGNEEILKLLERAKVADHSYATLQRAIEAENEGKLEQALTAYQGAAKVDPASLKAQSGVSRMRSQIEERDFAYYYSEATRADAEERYEDAITNYRSALEIFPNRTELEDAIARAYDAKHQNDIVSRITQAYDFEREHDWASARDLYQELVQMEPELQEAKDGLLRTGRMIRSILRYETLIETSKTEAQRAEFQMAIRTFDKAMQSKPEYLPLTEEGERLRKFLQLQSQPVPVQIISDESTWVSIQGPTQRKPDKIGTEQVALLPGKYFIIGRKKGYQDVRFSLQVRAGMPIQPLTVICDTKHNY